MYAAAGVHALFCVEWHNYNTYVSVATDHVCLICWKIISISKLINICESIAADQIDIDNVGYTLCLED